MFKQSRNRIVIGVFFFFLGVAATVTAFEFAPEFTEFFRVTQTTNTSTTLITNGTTVETTELNGGTLATLSETPLTTGETLELTTATNTALTTDWTLTSKLG